MNPTLHEPELMEVKPYNHRPFRVGDVILFLPAEAGQPVVHRIIRVTPAGISTRGDNNTREDSFLLQPKNIIGQVVAAWLGQQRRRIRGGLPGRLIIRWRRILERGVRPILHPLYQALSHGGVLVRLLPARLRPRVVVFHIKGRDRFHLLLGKRTIGRYDDQRNRWQVQRPFRLFVDGRLLPKPNDKERPNRQFSTDREKPLNHFPAQGEQYELVLADGRRWEIAGGDEEAASIVSQLGCTMQLRVAKGAIEPSRPGNLRRLFVRVDAHTTELNSYVPLAGEPGGAVTCILSPCAHWGGAHVNLMRLSLVFAREAQAHGGVLLHGALAERDGSGVILAAPGGTGKTTASNRLFAPWRSLCDDTTLVVRDENGQYLAHPWPTWSRFQNGGPGGTWDVQKAVPLKGIFILTQAPLDRRERVGPGQAVSLLVESVAQVSLFMTMGLRKDELRALRLEWFDNLCSLARAIPAHLLHISLTGAFWQEIEPALADTI
jgi:hypothetical protein